MVTKIINTYKIAFSGLSKENWLLSSVVLLNRSGAMAVAFMSIYITHVMHRTIGDAGLIITLYGIGGIAGAALGGFLTDTIGFRRVQIITSFCSGVLFILFGLVNDFNILSCIAVLLGLVSDAFRPANFTAIAAYSKPGNLARSYSLNRLAINIGWGFGSTIGGILAAINYHLLFWVEGLVYILVSLLIFVLLPKPVHTDKGEKEKNSVIKSPWNDVFFIKFLFLSFIYITCFYLMFRLVPVFWKEKIELGEALIGFLLGLNGIIIAVFEMVLLQYIQNKRSKTYYIVLGVLLTAIGYVFLLFVGKFAVIFAFIAVVFITVGEMFALPFINTSIMERADDSNRGKYAGAYTLAWSCAQIVGPLGGAFIVEKSNYNSLWLVLIFLCLVLMAVYKMIFKKAKLALDNLSRPI